MRDERLILTLLESVAEADDETHKASFRVVGHADRDVGRHLVMLRDEGLIRYIHAGSLQDPDGMIVKALTPAGYDRLAELKARLDRPARHWLAEHYQWVAGALLVPIALAAVGWLLVG